MKKILKRNLEEFKISFLGGFTIGKEAINQIRETFCRSIKKEVPEVKELADGTQLSNEELERLKGMNDIYTQVILSDGSQIYSKRTDQVSGFPVLRPERPKAFIARFNHQSRIARKNAAIAWDKWSGKNFKPDGVGFYPNIRMCPETVLNLFDGFAVSPIEGDCSPYLNHIEQVICSGDTLASKCFINYRVRNNTRSSQRSYWDDVRHFVKILEKWQKLYPDKINPVELPIYAGMKRDEHIESQDRIIEKIGTDLESVTLVNAQLCQEINLSFHAGNLIINGQNPVLETPT